MESTIPPRTKPDTLKPPRLDATRNRVLAAKNEGGRRVDAGRAPARPAPGSGQEARLTDLADSGEAILKEAQGAESEQQAMLEGAPVEQTYQAALASYVEAKHEQVERLAGRLETLIEQQETRMRTATNRPGIFSRPSTKRAWRNQQTQQQARLRSLHARLGTIHEIKEGMGLHSPRIEEMATRKMRAEHPELASDWDAMREAMRRHELLVREQKHEQAQAQALERPGRAQSRKF